MPLQISFNPFPIIETQRLILRQLRTDDAPALYKLRSDPETMKFVPRPIMEQEAEALTHIEMINEKISLNEGINWAISFRDNPEFIGIIGHFKLMTQDYRSEIGYMLAREHRCKGIMSEAIEAVLRYGFEQMGLHSVEAIIDPENVASATVLERSGFVREAHLKENQYYDGRFIDTVIYSLLNPASARS